MASNAFFLRETAGNVVKTTNSCLVVSLILLVVILVASFQNTLDSLYTALVVLMLMFVVRFFYERAARQENTRMIADVRARVKAIVEKAMKS